MTSFFDSSSGNRFLINIFLVVTPVCVSGTEGSVGRVAAGVEFVSVEESVEVAIDSRANPRLARGRLARGRC